MSKNTLELTDANFAETVKNSDVPVLVDFWAPWCGPCRIVGPIVEELAESYDGRLSVGKLNTDDKPTVASEFNIRSIPTLLFFKDGRVVDQLIGAVPKAQLEKKVEEVLAG